MPKEIPCSLHLRLVVCLLTTISVLDCFAQPRPQRWNYIITNRSEVGQLPDGRRVRFYYQTYDCGHVYPCEPWFGGCTCPDIPSCACGGPGIYLDPDPGCAVGYCDGEIPFSARNWCTRYSPGVYVDNCVIKGSYCKWEELPPCGWDDKEINGVGVAPWDAGPGITLTRCLTNPDSTDNDTNRYLPKYGDTLCYVLKVTRPIDVVVKLWGSTYEGIAMNAPVPDTVGLYEDSSSVKYCDLVLLGGEFDGFVSGQFQQTRTIHVDSAVNVKVLVMDYAAHGYIRAYQATNPNNSARHPQTIIKGYSDWTSNADPDSDGFTRWEEYRGFIQKYGDVYSHVRLDSTKPELFYHPDSLVLIDQDDLVSILEGEELLGATLYDYGQIDFDNEATNNVATITQAYLSGLDSLRRYFIDFNCHYLDTAG